MDFKKLALATMVAGALAGCNSSDDNNSGGGNPPIENPIQISSYRVIDGYLNNAEVCVYPPKVHASADHCIPLDYKTGEKGGDGHIDIPEHLQGGTVVARIIAGETVDKDTVGFVGRSYEMVSVPGSDVITPFTTIAAVEGKSIEEVASSMGLSEDLISGDYVAAKAGDTAKETSNNNDASRVHLVARTMATQLATSITDNKPEALAQAFKSVDSAIDDLVNNDRNLEEVEIELDREGDAHTHDRVSSLEDFLVGDELGAEGNIIYQASMNAGYFKREGVTALSMDSDNLCFYDNPNDIPTSCDLLEYVIEGDYFGAKDENGEMEGDHFIYLSRNLGLGVAKDDDDLLIYSTYNMANQDEWGRWDNRDFWVGEDSPIVWHIIEDGYGSDFESRNIQNGSPEEKPEPEYITVQAISESELEITINGEHVSTNDWYIRDHDGVLVVVEEDEDEKDLEYSRLEGSNDIVLAMDLSDVIGNYGRPVIWTRDESVANSIIEKWLDANE